MAERIVTGPLARVITTGCTAHPDQPVLPAPPVESGWRRPELLAPAGDPDKLAMAIQYGADAVYLGTKNFSLRSAGGNFDVYTELPEAVKTAHQQGVRVYVAMNILARPADLAGLRESVQAIQAARADAVIVSDPGVFSLIREETPDMAIHISTQASVSNARACRFWYEQGAGRIILARELSLQEIRAIRADIPAELELEAFVHGAMCVAWSGRCLLSTYLAGRDANRGRCAQPCRWKFKGSEYQITEEKRPDLPLFMEEDRQGTYLFSSKDLCMIDHVPELAQAGLSSLKIEGRMKSGFYVATVVKAYREALDRLTAQDEEGRFDPAWLEDLSKTTHRPFDTGFFYQHPMTDSKIFAEDTTLREASVVGVVRAYLPESSLVLIEQRNRILTGESLEIVQPRGRHIDMQATEILDLERHPIPATPHPHMLYYLPVSEPIAVGAFLRRLGDKDQPVSG